MHRVSKCNGSVRENADVPNTTSVFAAEGTLLHEIAADCLTFGHEPEDYIGRQMQADGFTFNVGTGTGETDPTCISMALDWFREQPGELFVETLVKLDRWMPEQFGTCDIAIWDAAEGVLTIADWKFGMGVMVETVGNEQLRAYALGFYDTVLVPRGIHPATIRIIIEQPRGTGGQRFYEPWEITLRELLAFGDELAELWIKINDPAAPLCAGAWCDKTFCGAKTRKPKPGDLTGCTTYDQFNLDLISSKFEDLDDEILELPANPTPERRWFIVKHAKMFEKWLAGLHEASVDAAAAGQPDPGSKLVAGRRGGREWGTGEIDEIIAEGLLINALGSGAYTQKVKSPAQAEKDLATRRGKAAHPGAWDVLSRLVRQGDGKPILVSEDDPRPALATVDDKFDEEPDETPLI